MATYGDQATNNNLDLGASNDAASAAINTGRNAINSFDPTGTAQKQQTNLGDSGLGGMLAGETNPYISKYSQTVASNPTVTSLYNAGNTMFNVPQLANESTYLNNEVTNALPDAYSAAKGFDIGAPQVQNGIASKLAYLTPQANAATARSQTAQSLAGQFVQAGQAQNTQNLLPVQEQGQLLAQQEAAQSTGWNQAAQQEFQGYVDKMNAGVTLSQTEMSRANQLASLEEAYQSKLTENATALATEQQKQKFQTVGNNLVNTFTGGIINPAMLTAKTGSYTLPA